MKKLVLTMALAGLTAGAFAQGTITFATAGDTGHVQTNGTSIGGPTGNGAYTVEIFSTTASAAQAGVDPDTGTATFANVTAGSSGFFEVVGWTGNFANWDAAVAGNAKVGYSSIFANTTGGSGSPPSTPATLSGWNGQLNLAPV